MRKIITSLVVAVVLLFSFSSNGHADENEDFLNSQNEIVSKVMSPINISKIETTTLNSEAQDSETHIITTNDWNNALIEEFYKKYPDYQGEISFVYENLDGEIVNENESSPLALTNAPSTGTPNSSVGKVVSVWYNGDGTITQISGSAFKVRNNKAGSAAHIVYNKTRGFADTVSIFFGLQPVPVGMQFNAVYSVTEASTNQDWVSTKSFRSDFGSYYISLDVGSHPANLSLLKDPPVSVSNVKNYGYPGWVNQTAFNTSTGSVHTSLNIIYAAQVYEADNNTVVSESGMSGGPLMNSSNQVIGINSWRSDNGVGTTSGFMKMSTPAYNNIVD